MSIAACLRVALGLKGFMHFRTRCTLTEAWLSLNSTVAVFNVASSWHSREDPREEIVRVGRNDVGLSGELVSMSVSWNAASTLQQTAGRPIR